MAVVELYTSREMHITKVGTTIARFFSCSDTDWNAGGDDTTTLPVIGDKWSDARPDLCVTDKTVRWRSNTECVVEVTYSRGGFNYPNNLPDTRSSIEETFDFSVQPIQLIGEDSFWDFTNSTSKSWRVHFQETYEGKEPPPVPQPGPHVVWTAKMNVSQWSWNTIKDSLGKVNDRDTLAQYVSSITRPNVWTDVTGDDTGFWLFVGFNATQIGNDNIQLLQTFQHSGVHKWNKPYSVAAMNIYQTANLLALPWPETEDDTVDDGLR